MRDAAVLGLEPMFGYQQSDRQPQINIQPSDRLTQILQNDDDDFFHLGQQTNKMLRDHNRRSRLSHEHHRKSLVQRLVDEGCLQFSISSSAFTEVNPFDVILTMQICDLDGCALLKKTSPDNLLRIMKETETLIRLPDREDEGLNASQVSIQGSLENVERARSRLRDLTKLSLSFAAENNVLDYGIENLRKWLAERTKKWPKDLDFEVVHPQRKMMFDKTTIRVTGTFAQEDAIVKCTYLLRSALYNSVDADQVLIIAEMKVPSSQMDNYTAGDRAEQLVSIARNANVFLHFIPIPPSRPCFNDFQSFIITGQMPEGVCKALKIMTALQPVQLSLNVLGEHLVHKMDPLQTKKIFDEKSLVHIVISPSIKQILRTDPVIHFICMTAQEYNIGNIYNTLRIFIRAADLDKKTPSSDTPKFMSTIVRQIVVSPRFLDIQNYEFPDMILSTLNEKGDVLLQERSADMEDLESNCFEVPTIGISDSDSMMGTATDTCRIPQDIFNLMYSYDTTVGTNIRTDGRFDSNGFSSSRGYYRSGGGFRGSRRGLTANTYLGDKRNSGSYPRRLNRDRDYGGRNEYPRTRNANNSESERSGGTVSRDADDSRRGRWAGRSQVTRNTVDEYSIDGYMKHYINPKNPDQWKRSQDKVILSLNTKSPGSHNSTLEGETDLPRRMTPSDLINRVNEELSSVSPNSTENSENNRMTYARMVEGAVQKPENSVEPSENGTGDRTRRSVSSNELSRCSAYSRDSPFGAGVRHLDRRIDVEHVLFSINCDKYVEHFRKAKIISLPLFLRLDEEELVNMGVSSSLDRSTIMEYVRKLREAQNRVKNRVMASSNDHL